jgi:enterochelin esterase family protein
MDNLLADGKARPGVTRHAVRPRGQGSTGKLPEVRALQASFGVDPAARGGRGPGGTSFMEKDLLGNVLPLVEKEYRVLKDANHRAIIGHSMGGMQASTIGLNHRRCSPTSPP